MLYRILKKIVPDGRCKMMLKTAFMYLCRIFPIVPDKVVFVSYFGKYHNDSPRAIFREMVRQRPHYKYVWLMEDGSKKIKNAKVVDIKSPEALYHLATARMWVDNWRKESWTVKRRGQYYVQTWHGNVAIKKIEKDAIDVLSKTYIKDAKKDSRMADLFLSGSKWRTESYRRVFWYDGEILEVGYPYSDVLYGDKELIHKKVCRSFSFPDSTKLFVYAPTFRVDGNLKCYDMDYERVLKALRERFGGEWKILLRMHPNVRERHTDLKYTDDIIDATVYEEMTELAAGADFLVSDYSSTMIDAMEAKTPGLIYASDFDEYNKDRSLYFGKDELPYKFCETNDQLIHEILNFSMEECLRKSQQFYTDRGFFNDAHSSERVVKYLFSKF